MKLLKLIVVVVVIILSTPFVCIAQYEEFYKSDNNTYITTLSNAKLYELSDIYTNNIINGKPLTIYNVRDLIDVSDVKVKKLKKPQSLHVLRYTNTNKQEDFNAYIVEYNEKLWVLNSCDVQDNTNLQDTNSQIFQHKKNLDAKRQILKYKSDSLKNKLDSSVDVCTKECMDSLNYYKALKLRLPDIRDSLVTAIKLQEQAKADKIYNEWYNIQPTTTKNAAKVIEITYADLDYPNSAGGCDYTFSYINKSTKTIKYLYWTGTVYNAVNDPAYCEIRGTATCNGKDTGPVEYGEPGGGVWGTVVYNYSADTMKLSNINIKYIDGSSVNIGAADIRRLLNAPSTDVYIDTYSIRKRVMSDEDCQRKINIWNQRLEQLKNKKFSKTTYENIYNDDSYNLNWLELKSIESNIEVDNKKINEIDQEIEVFNKFIQFEKYSNTVSNSYYSQNNSYALNRTNSKKSPFITFGLEGSVEGLKSFSTGWGLSMRLGRFDSMFNATIGVKYQYTIYSKIVSYSFREDGGSNYLSNYVYGGADLKQKVNQVVFPLLVNWNMITGNTTSLYFGAGYEFGVLLSNKISFESQYGDFNAYDFYTNSDISDLIQLCVPSRAIVLQLGCAGRHWDWKIYYKINTQYSKIDNGESGAIGTAFTYYF